MNKIEFIAISLSHEIMAEILDYKCDYAGFKYDKIISISQWSKDGTLWSAITLNGAAPSIDRIKPICRPLDLTKEIDHGGEAFIPIVELAKFVDEFNNAKPVFVEVKSVYGLHYEWYSEYDNIRRSVPFSFYLKLIEWHFDIAGLIEKGEAIDVNTLEVNPYGQTR